MKKLLIIAPHMSTGGLPQVVVKKVELLKGYYDIYVVEWDFVAGLYVVQRNKVIDILNDKFISLDENKSKILEIIDNISPDHIMIEELSETFIPEDILPQIYKENRKYKIFESTHSSYSAPEWKKFMPDKFIFVSPYSVSRFKDIGVPIDLIEYPINYKKPNKEYYQKLLGLDPNYKHVINIGLFTPGKNQGYLFEVAKQLKNYKIQFHFIGNQASNFIEYWEPLLENVPDNCKIWGERDDVNSFIQACDAHFFSSVLELNPLSVKESLEYFKPTMIFNLETYMGKYDNTNNIHFLTNDLTNDSNNLLSILGLDRKPKIRIVHILLDPNYPEDIPLDKWNDNILRQEKSISCWDNLKNNFFDYVQRYSIVNRTELPYENCKDPEIINPSKTLENKSPTLSYGHYGSYKSQTNAILEYFSDDIDALIIVEGDSYTELTPDEFYDKVIDAYNLSQKIDARLVTLAGYCFMSGVETWSLTKDYGDWLQVPHFLLTTAFMIMKSERINIIDKIHNTGWHSMDLWLAWNYHDTVSILSSKQPIMYQHEGYSLIDYNTN